MSKIEDTTNVSISVRVPNRYRATLSESGSLGSSVKEQLIQAIKCLKEDLEEHQSSLYFIPEEPSVAVIVGIYKTHEETLQDIAKHAKLDSLPTSQISRIILTAWLDGKIQAKATEEVPESGRNTSVVTEDSSPVLSHPVRATDDAKGDDDLLAETLKVLNLKPRHEQKLLFRQMSKHMRRQDARSVLFAEAGTGIGKTLTYLIQAGSYIQEQRAKGEPVRVCISAPTYSNISQLMETWDKSLFEIYGFRPVAIGSSKDFVSEQRLIQLMNEFEEANDLNVPVEGKDDQDISQRAKLIEDVRAWMNNPVAPMNFRSRAHWTLEGLCSAVPAFHYVDDVRLDSRHDNFDLGWISYQSQFINAQNSDLWVMTHALLASKTRQRMCRVRKAASEETDAEAKAAVSIYVDRQKELKEAKRLASISGEILEKAPRESLAQELNALYEAANDESNFDQGDLPKFDLLLVDEAHAIDSAFDLVLSSRISLWSILKDLKAIDEEVGSTTHRKIKSIFDDLRDNAVKAGPIRAFEESTSIFDEADLMGEILHCLKSVKENKKSRVTCSQEHRRINAAKRALDIAMKHKNDPRGMVATIDSSPDRNWPRISIGRTSLESEMDYLWSHISKTTILLSGTLYETRMGNNISTMRINLNVSVDLTRTMDPIHAPWSIDPITACVIGSSSRPDGTQRFSRPKSDDKNREYLHKLWCEDIAMYIWGAHRPTFKDQGGMLVLCTSFEDIRMISERIVAQMGKLNNVQPVLAHQKDSSLADLKEQFFDICANAAAPQNRPILLACGAGWTGFDLSDGKMPHAITDLVIVNAPFGVLPKMISKRRRGFLSTVADLDIWIRQGIGRLIRNAPPPGSTRRMHWLDARIHQASSNSWGKMVKQLLIMYPKRIKV